ncbi:conserved Plasmodium protein, unknown function [Plasmodium ovale]|uniref:Seipin domain-containing protein n=1 Tax=Plasmodium ovale TaxID=36330 RepID=A0A1D3KX65_PLAOA|nr:conserved Plasmodium protein, unknown function [Plasmodium ovale]
MNDSNGAAERIGKMSDGEEGEDANEVRGGEAVKEIHDEEAVKEIHDEEAVKEIHDEEAVKEIHDEEAVKEIHDEEAVKEIHDEEAVKEIHDEEAVKEIHDEEAVKEIHDGEAVKEIHDGEAVKEIHDEEAVKEVHGEEDANEARNDKIVKEGLNADGTVEDEGTNEIPDAESDVEDEWENEFPDVEGDMQGDNGDNINEANTVNSNINDCSRISGQAHRKNVRQFCKLKRKYSCLGRRNRTSYKYRRSKKKKSRYAYFTKSVLVFFGNGMKYAKGRYARLKTYCQETFPNLNFKYGLYVLVAYVSINVMLFLFSIFLYFVMYCYVIPQNKYVYPINFSLAKNPIEDYLKNKYYESGKNIVENSHYPSMNKSEEIFLKHLNSVKGEIINSIRNKDPCCCSEKWNYRSYSSFPFLNRKDTSLNNQKEHFFDNELDFKYLQNNILTGQVNFQHISGEKKVYNEKNFFTFFIPIWRKQKISKLKIRKGYKIDIFLNISYMNNDYNDKFNFLQLETEIYDNKDHILLRNEKLHINNKNYDFINKLHLLFNTPFYFFNLFNRKTTQISLINDYEYVTDIKKVRIYLYPPIQMYEAYIIVVVYVNFIYYYMYKYPFLFFYVFVFLLSSFLIFLNTVFFLFGGLYYYSQIY